MGSREGEGQYIQMEEEKLGCNDCGASQPGLDDHRNCDGTTGD